MKPRIDERWVDPDGVESQIVEIVSLRPFNQNAESALAFVRVMIIESGEKVKVRPAEFSNWKRVKLDPLRGVRALINQGAVTITFPGTKPCPVVKGDVFHLSSLNVRVSSTDWSGKGEKAKHVVYLDRIERSRPLFMRRNLPDPLQAGPLEERVDEQQASIDSHYTSSPSMATPGSEQVVDPADVGNTTADRRHTARFLNEVKAEQRRIKSLPLEDRLSQLTREADENGVDVGRHLRAIENRIEAAEKRVGEKTGKRAA